MSNIYQLPKKDEALDQASEWLAKLDRGLTAKEESELKVWLNDNPENQQMFIKVAELWGKMDSLSRLSDIFPQPMVHSESKNRIPQFAIAALALFTVVAGLWNVGSLENTDVIDSQGITQSFDEQLYQTNVGEKSTIMLADGSEIILNTNSSVKIRFTSKQRLLYLDRGEIHIQVAHDLNRPLRVYVGNKIVQAVGTEFNIEIIDDQKIELIVTEGKVLVSVNDFSAQQSSAIVTTQQASTAVTKTATLSMVEGEKVILGATQEKVETITNDDINVKLSWRGGNLIFSGESLEHAISEIERYTQVEFIIVDENLKQLRVAGLFKAGDVNGLLETLEDNFNITYRKVGNEKIILSSNAP